MATSLRRSTRLENGENLKKIEKATRSKSKSSAQQPPTTARPSQDHRCPDSIKEISNCGMCLSNPPSTVPSGLSSSAAPASGERGGITKAKASSVPLRPLSPEGGPSSRAQGKGKDKAQAEAKSQVSPVINTPAKVPNRSEHKTKAKSRPSKPAVQHVLAQMAALQLWSRQTRLRPLSVWMTSFG